MRRVARARQLEAVKHNNTHVHVGQNLFKFHLDPGQSNQPQFWPAEAEAVWLT